MKLIKSLFLSVMASFLVVFGAQASPLQYVMPDYYLGQIVKGVLNIASKVGYPQYEVLQAPDAQQKAQASLQKIYENPRFNYTYNAISIVVIRGLEGEPNGFSFGANLFITKSMIELLSSAELTAVIAHELAHSEKAHNLQKAPLPLEATAYQLVTLGEALKSGRWPQKKDLVDSIQVLIQTGGLAMELQADCIAAQQLEFMQQKGLPHKASDLISATNKIFGYDVTTDTSEDPVAIRTRALVNKTYALGPCDIF
jgi:Zn-dependent protease with chaperone function